MCQYCGCREITTVGQLMDEHAEIQNRLGDTRRAVEAGDFAKAATIVRELEAILRVHNAVEEKALYPAIGKFEEFTEQTDILFHEHDDVDEIIAGVLKQDDAGTLEAVDWAEVITAFDVLYEHIIREDNGLFPASAIMLDSDDWEACEAAREEAEASG